MSQWINNEHSYRKIAVFKEAGKVMILEVIFQNILDCVMADYNPYTSTLKIILENNDWDYKDAKPTDFVYMNIYVIVDNGKKVHVILSN